MSEQLAPEDVNARLDEIQLVDVRLDDEWEAARVH